MKTQFLQSGRIVGTHGIKGEVRIDPWCDSPGFLTKFKKLYLTDNTALDIIQIRAHKNIVLAKIKGVDTIEQAEKMRGKIICINRDDVKLEAGRYFVEDLFGCKVFDADTDEPLGKITDVSQTGANDVWHITKSGKEYLIPAIDEVLVDVDIDNEKVVIRPLKGIFDDED